MCPGLLLALALATSLEGTVAYHDTAITVHWISPNVKLSLNKLRREKASRIELVGCANDYYPFQLVITSSGPTCQVRASLDGDLEGHNSGIQTQLDVQKIVWVSEGGPKYGERRYYPDRLEPFDSGELSKASPLALWCTLYVPPGQLPGKYQGNVKLVLMPDKAITIPLSVDVKPFSIPKEPTLRFTGSARSSRAWVENLAAHRMSLRGVPAERPRLTFKGNDPVFDWRAFDSAASYVLDEKGMGCFQFPFSYIGGKRKIKYSRTKRFGLVGPGDLPQEFKEKFVNTCRAIAEHLEEKGWLEKSYHNYWDEPRPPADKQVVEIGRLLKSAHPKIRPCVMGGGFVKGLEEVCSRWLFSQKAYDPDRVARLKARGDLVGLYNPWGCYEVDAPATFPRLFLWWAFKENLDWLMQYRMDNCYWKAGSGYTFSRYGYSAAYIYPSPKGEETGPLNSIRWELTREGLEDFEALVWHVKQTKQAMKQLGVEEKEFDPRGPAVDIVKELVDGYIRFSRNGAALEEARMRVLVEAAYMTNPPLLLAKIDRSSRKVRVVGYCEPGAELQVDGTAVPLTGNRFECQLLMPRTRRLVEIVARKAGMQKRVLRASSLFRQEFPREFRNGGFEQGARYWRGPYGRRAFDGKSRALDASVRYKGKASLRLEAGAAYHEAISVAPNAHYRLTYATRGNADRLHCFIYHMDRNMQSLKVNGLHKKPTDSWKAHSRKISPVKRTRYLVVRFNPVAKKDSVCWVDDVSLVSSAAPKKRK